MHIQHFLVVNRTLRLRNMIGCQLVERDGATRLRLSRRYVDKYGPSACYITR